MPTFISPDLIGLPVGSTYAPAGALLFDGDGDYLSVTPTSTGNRRTLTFSAWVKRTGLDHTLTKILWGAGDASAGSYCLFGFSGSNLPSGKPDRLWFESQVGAGSSYGLYSTAEFSDVSGWMHVMLRLDTTQSTAGNRVRMYVNGVQQTLTDVWSGQPAQDTDYYWNLAGTTTHIGKYAERTDRWWDGYMADACMYDGASLGPDSFGETNDNGIWVPIEPPDTGFGTNGFHLKFDDADHLGKNSAYASPSSYVPVSVNFDGTNDYLSRGAAITGLSDGTEFTLSFWVRKTGGDGGHMILFTDNAGHFQSQIHTNNKINIKGHSAGASELIDMNSSVEILADGRWHHVMFSTNTSSDTHHLYVDGVDAADKQNSTTGTMDLTQTDYTIGGASWGVKMHGDIADLYFTDEYIDLSSSSNRIKFIDANKLPVSLGSDGSTPTGTAAKVYLNQNTLSTWHTNAGTGGGFTESGALTDGLAVRPAGVDFVASSSIGANNIIAGGPANSTTKEVTIHPCFDPSVTSTSGVSYVLAALSNNNLTAGDGAGGGAKFAICNNPIPTTGKWSAKLTWTASTTNDWFNLMVVKKVGFPQTGSGGHSGTDATTTLAAVLADGPGFSSTVRIFTAGTQVGSDHSIIAVGQSLEALVDRDANTVKWYANGTLLDTENIMAGLQGEDCYFAVYVEDSKCTIDFDFTASDTDYSNKPCTRTVTGVGNYATLNPLDKHATYETLSEGNLKTVGSNPDTTVRSTIALGTTNKWYWEMTANDSSGIYTGVCLGSKSWTTGGGVTTGDDNAWQYNQNAKWYGDGAGSGATYGNASSWTTGDVIGVAYDATTGTIWCSKNDVWIDGNGTDNSATVKSEIEAGTTSSSMKTGIDTSVPIFASSSDSGSKTRTFNFGANGFTYTPPSGFSALATQNLPKPTITDPSAYFQTKTYTGSTGAQSITLDGNSGMQPDMVCIKTRSHSSDHALFDSVRGVNKQLRPNHNADEYDSYSDILTDFDSDGFTLGADTNVTNVNTDTRTYVAWCWKAGGTAVTDADGMNKTDGSASSSISISASATAGFSIIKYTGNGAASTITHGLNSTPKMIIVKNIGTTEDWVVYHEGVGAGHYLRLNTDGTPAPDTGMWLNSTPSSTTFNVSAGYTKNNESGEDYIAYVFADVEGYSKFGSYIANGSIDGSFCYTGFKPALVIIKKATTATQSWIMKDGTRNPHNPATRSLYANLTNAESPDSVDNDNDIHLLSTGFKITNSGHTGSNSSGSTYIYCAFAETPFASNNRAR